MKQFTFYELYSSLLNGLNGDEEAGRFAKNICAYVFDGIEPQDGLTAKESFYWSNIEDMLEVNRAQVTSGDGASLRGFKCKHFTFYETYYKALLLLTDKQGGAFMKAVCAYMFEDIVPTFRDKELQSTFDLCRRKLDISRKRKNIGSKGGKVKAKPKAMTYAKFREAHPEIVGDIYGKPERYKNERIWDDVEAKLKTDPDLIGEKNIYKILTVYLEKYGETR